MSRFAPHAIGMLQVAAASVCFGFIGLFGKFAFREGLSVGELLSFRFLFASLLLGLGLAVASPRRLKIPPKQILLSLLLGIFGYAVFATLYFLAIRGLSVALAALLLYTFPFWTLLFNAVLGERPAKSAWLSLLTAFAGLILLLWGEVRVESLGAVTCGIGSAVAYSIYIIVSGRLQKGVSPIGSGFWIILGATIALFAFHSPEISHVQTWSATAWRSLAALAVIGTIVPLVLIQAGLQRLSSSETALLSMIEPVTAAVAASFFLHEALSLRQFIGAALVLGSLAALALLRRR